MIRALLLLSLSACATTTVVSQRNEAIELPAAELCEHEVAEQECVRCHPDLVDGFKARGDWCAEHALPETQCLECHPGLTFVKLPALPADADLQHLSTMGEDVEALEPHVAPGKVTVFDFFATWCGPCRNVDAYLYKQLAERDDFAVRKLNVMSWDTPLAKRWMERVPMLPYVIVYGRDGKKVRAVTGLDLEALDQAVREGASR